MSAIVANKEAIRQKESEEIARLERFRNILNRKTKPAAVDPMSIGEMLYNYFPEHAINVPGDFKRSVKSQNEARIRIVFAKFLFCKYFVPRHVLSIFSEDFWNKWDGSKHGEIGERIGCFFILGSGKSLFKVLFQYKGLTKKEAHVFTNCSHDLSYNQAIVYSMAMSDTDNVGHALRIARSKFGDWYADNGVQERLLRESVRFFVRFPVPIKEMNDLFDYIRHQNSDYSLKGRTLSSLQKQMHDWHYELARAKKIGGGNWVGLPIKDALYKNLSHSYDTKHQSWKIEQIKTGNDLLKEGSAMRHCVSVYKNNCMNGRCGIFSVKMTKQNFVYPVEADWQRQLTIEVSNYNEVVQVRGFANRAAHSYERNIIGQWMAENGLTDNRWTW